MYDVLIAGGGPAGLTAGVYASRGGFSVLIIERAFVGGQMALSHIIENFPGLEEPVAGAQLAHSMKTQAQKEGAEIITEDITAFDISGKIKTITTKKNTYEAKAVILATGAIPKRLGIPGEGKLSGSGVSYCATCDGAFFKNRDVAVIGGGNTALEDALFLSMFCKKVYLVHRRDQFRGQSALVARVRKLENVELILDSIPVAVEGEHAVESLKLKNVKTEKEQSIEISGLFVAIGQLPKTQLFSGIVEMNDNGYVVAGENCKTKLPGVFVAGDIRTKDVRQIVTAAADGAVAAIGAEQYLLSEFE